jgi:hypothetical protein
MNSCGLERIASTALLKTMGLDSKTHNLFLHTADFATAPAPTAGQPQPTQPRGAAISATR